MSDFVTTSGMRFVDRIWIAPTWPGGVDLDPGDCDGYLSGALCAGCDQPILGEVVAYHRDPIYGRVEGEYHGDCLDAAGEAAEQRALADYYGGSGPMTARERYEAAHAEKKRLR